METEPTDRADDIGHTTVHEPFDVSRDKLIHAAIAEIEANPYQYREDWGDLPALAKSIEKIGVITTPIGRPNPGTIGKPYQLAAGERRLRAAALAGLTHIPLIVRAMGDDEMIEVLFQENLNRKDTTPLEEARGFKAALDRAYTVEQLMVKTGRSRGHIYGRLKLLELATYAMKALQSGELPVAHAELIARIADRDAQERCTKEVLGKIDNNTRDDLAGVGIEHEGISKDAPSAGDAYPQRTPQLLSFRTTKELIRRRYMTRLSLASFEPDDATLLPSAGACTPCVHRAANQPALPGLVDAGKGDDYCTKASCFEEKTSAAFKREATRAKERGVEVLSGQANTRLVFGYNATEVAGGSPYVDLHDKMPSDIARAGASQTWGKALGKKLADVPRVLVADGTGAPRELLDRGAAIEVLRGEGKIDKPTKPDKPAAAKPKKKDDKEERAQELKEQAFVRVLGQIADCAATDKRLDAGAGELALWKWLAFAITSTGVGDGDAWAMVAERRGLKLKKGEQWIEWESLQKAIRDAKSMRELRGLVVELLVAKLEIEESGLADGTTGAAEQAFKSALKLFDADWSEAMTWAKTAAKAEAQVEAAKSSPKKPAAKLATSKAKSSSAKPAAGTACNAVALQDDEWVCAREKGHDGRHMSEVSPGGTTAMWGVDDGRERGKIFPISLQGRTLGRTLKQSGGWSTPVDVEKKLDEGLAAIAKKESGAKADNKSATVRELEAIAERATCSECGAQPGKSCVVKSGQRAPRPHAVRVDFAKATTTERCTAMHDPYGRCLLEPGHAGQHEVLTEQKSRLFFTGKPIAPPKKKGGSK